MAAEVGGGEEEEGEGAGGGKVRRISFLSPKVLLLYVLLHSSVIL